MMTLSSIPKGSGSLDSLKANRTSKPFAWGKALIYALLTFWAFTTVFPFLWVINNSFKTSQSIMSSGFSLALEPIWDNYANAFSKQQIIMWKWRKRGLSLLMRSTK